jgi:hypothetical protein
MRPLRCLSSSFEQANRICWHLSMAQWYPVLTTHFRQPNPLHAIYALSLCFSYVSLLRWSIFFGHNSREPRTQAVRREVLCIGVLYGLWIGRGSRRRGWVCRVLAGGADAKSLGGSGKNVMSVCVSRQDMTGANEMSSNTGNWLASS